MNNKIRSYCIATLTSILDNRPSSAATASEWSKSMSINSLYLLLIVLYLGLAMHLPVTIYTTAHHDDMWFLQNAEQILNGRWMGPFNSMTLIKGPFYSYFLAMNSALGLSVTLSIAWLYVISCLAVVYVLSGMGLNRMFALCLFTCLLFQPALFPMRIIRDNVYHSLTLLLISGITYIVFHEGRKTNRLYVILFGLSGGFFWMTREEGVWVIPGLLVLCVYRIILCFKKKDGLVDFLKLLFIFTAAAILPILLTATINKLKYGAFQVVDVKSPEFISALNALNSVRVDPEVAFVPVSRRKREVLYEVSPAFRELQDFFENTGKRWSEPGCSVQPHTCGDYAAGWFMWALRDGVGGLGYYADPKKAANFYSALASEVGLACQNGKILCDYSPIPYMPKMSYQSLSLMPEKLKEAIYISLYQMGIPLDEGSSQGSPESVADAREFLGNPRTTASEEDLKIVMSGWYYPRSGQDWLQLACQIDGQEMIKKLPRKASPDLAMYFETPSATAQRFSVAASESQDCSLVFDEIARLPLRLSILLKNKRSSINTNASTFHIDTIKLSPDPHRYNNWLAVKAQLINVYKSMTPFFLATGLLALLVKLALIALSKDKIDGFTVISVSLWILYFSRVLLVVLIDISSFPAVTHMYLMPAFPILLIAAFSSLVSLLNTVLNLTQIVSATKAAQIH
jgi:hypothetical protein